MLPGIPVAPSAYSLSLLYLQETRPTPPPAPIPQQLSTLPPPRACTAGPLPVPVIPSNRPADYQQTDNTTVPQRPTQQPATQTTLRPRSPIHRTATGQPNPGGSVTCIVGRASFTPEKARIDFQLWRMPAWAVGVLRKVLGLVVEEADVWATLIIAKLGASPMHWESQQPHVVPQANQAQVWRSWLSQFEVVVVCGVAGVTGPLESWNQLFPDGTQSGWRLRPTALLVFTTEEGRGSALVMRAGELAARVRGLMSGEERRAERWGAVGTLLNALQLQLEGREMQSGDHLSLGRERRRQLKTQPRQVDRGEQSLAQMRVRRQRELMFRPCGWPVCSNHQSRLGPAIGLPTTLLDGRKTHNHSEARVAAGSSFAPSHNSFGVLLIDRRTSRWRLRWPNGLEPSLTTLGRNDVQAVVDDGVRGRRRGDLEGVLPDGRLSDKELDEVMASRWAVSRGDYQAPLARDWRAD